MASGFSARALFTIGPDRIYRVEASDGRLYFLRTGGQFDADRGQGNPGGGVMMAVMATAEAGFRKHKKEELQARDPNRSPEELLAIHPHNYALAPDEVKTLTLLPKKWLLALFRPHVARIMLERTNGEKQEFHLEQPADLKTAQAVLPEFLGKKLRVEL